jgi:hypothetical protein
LDEIEKKIKRKLNSVEGGIINVVKSFGDKGFYGSQKTLGRKLRVNERTIRRHIPRLLEENILLKHKNNFGCIYIYNDNLL